MSNKFLLYPQNPSFSTRLFSVNYKVLCYILYESLHTLYAKIAHFVRFSLFFSQKNT